MLLIFAVCGFAAGFLRGGRLHSLAHHDIALFWLPVAAFLCKAAGPYLSAAMPEYVPELQLLVCLAHYALLGVFVWKNRWHGAWATVFGAGALLNFIVIISNGGAMPVSAAALEASAEIAAKLSSGEIFAYTPVTAATRFAALGDVLAFSPFGTLLGFASIGDLILGAGVAMLCFHLMKPPARRR